MADRKHISCVAMSGNPLQQILGRQYYYYMTRMGYAMQPNSPSTGDGVPTVIQVLRTRASSSK